MSRSDATYTRAFPCPLLLQISRWRGTPPKRRRRSLECAAGAAVGRAYAGYSVTLPA